MEINYKSYFYHFANKNLKWLSGDNQKLFVYNLKHKSKELIRYGWINPYKEIIYSINSEGFRCDNFSPSESVMFLGCSFTMGIGINLENSFPYIVSQKLGLNLMNLGIASSSADTAFRLGSYWIPKLKPKLVIYLEFFPARMEIFSNNTIYQLLPNSILILKDLENFYLNHWLTNDTNLFLNSLKNKLALELICQQNNVKFVYDNENITKTKQIDFARDLMHPGIKTHEIYAQELLKII